MTGRRSPSRGSRDDSHGEATGRGTRRDGPRPLRLSTPSGGAHARTPDAMAASAPAADARSRAARRPPPNPTVARLARERNPLRLIAGVLGPGFIAGASDDDPSGIGTYAQAGARFGYATLWMTIAMFPLMSAVQYVCAKVGMVSGRGLAGVLRERYPRPVLYVAVLAMVVANTVNAGADIGAVAAAIGLLVPVPSILFVVPVALGVLAVQAWGSYALIERIFKWLALALLAYVGAALLSRPVVADVLRGTLIPTIRADPGFVAMLVALLGTTISPYLFFWQASHEVEAEIDMGRRHLWMRRGATTTELRYALWDTLAGMAFSEAVAYFVIFATGAALFTHGQRDISSATQAAEALRPIAGDASAALLAVGLIGSGVLAIPVLTGSAAYAVSEMFGWPFGLDRSPFSAPQFYGVIAVATALGAILNFVGIDPIEALVLSAILNGLLAPPLLALIMFVANDRRIMGDRPNGRWLNALGWLTVAVMAVAAVALVVTTAVG